MKSISIDKKTKKKLQAFFNKYKAVSYKKGDIIFSPQDAISNILYIKKGYVRIQSVSKNGEELVLHIAKPGSFIPIVVLLANFSNKYYWEAITPVEVYKAPSKEVLRFLQKEEDILFNLTTRLAAGICGLLDRMESLVLESAYTKISSILLYFAKSYSHREHQSIIIEQKLTHSDLAAWTGLNRETVTRRMKLLQKAGIISYHKRQIIINDIKRLES